MTTNQVFKINDLFTSDKPWNVTSNLVALGVTKERLDEITSQMNDDVIINALDKAKKGDYEDLFSLTCTYDCFLRRCLDGIDITANEQLFFVGNRHTLFYELRDDLSPEMKKGLVELEKKKAEEWLSQNPEHREEMEKEMNESHD